MHPKALLSILRLVIKDADGRNKYGLHALPPKSVQALLGHASITLTIDVYGHL